MKKYFTSKIEWIPYEEGGRKNIPSKGTRYCPLIRMRKNNDCKDWSLDFVCPDFNETEIIHFSFLAEDAPYETINCNNSYDIYEGAKRVAVLTILSCH